MTSIPPNVVPMTLAVTIRDNPTGAEVKTWLEKGQVHVSAAMVCSTHDTVVMIAHRTTEDVTSDNILCLIGSLAELIDRLETMLVEMVPTMYPAPETPDLTDPPTVH